MSSNQPADGIFAMLVLGMILLCFLPKSVLLFLLAACILSLAAWFVSAVRSDRQEKQQDERRNADKKRSYRGPF